MDKIFHRTSLAQQMAQQLLRPGVLDEGLRSGLLIFGVRRIVKTTSLQADLVPALEEAGALVIYVDLQHAITSEEGNQMLLALKAARDAINPRPKTPGRFISVGTGSHRALVSELTARRNQAFGGATSIAYPVLDANMWRTCWIGCARRAW